MELSLVRPALYRVKRGQTAEEIAKTFGIPCRVLAAYNGLRAPPAAGALLAIPPAEDLYRVQGGETKSLLCGSPERFAEKNATAFFYPGQEVCL